MHQNTCGCSYFQSNSMFLTFQFMFFSQSSGVSLLFLQLESLVSNCCYCAPATFCLIQILKKKWGTSLLSCWRSSTRLRRLAGRPPCLLQLLVAKASSSLRLRLQLTLPLCLPQPPRHLGVAIVAVVLEREPAAISGLLPTRLHWLRQPLVFRWKIPVLSNSIPLRHLLLGGAK